ncbi:MAG: prolipoprotein diacylglyceryl transferase [Clostridia bacterium]|nr:prolipoprotein diacylglyceryl transferase [Clostridia bacterium]
MSTIMRDAAISFPMLGDWSINPSASYQLFGHTFYWYGTIIALGFLLAVLYCAHMAPRFGLTADNLYDLIVWILPVGIIGARIYYVVSEWANYSENLVNIFKIWEGGLAIYGGIIAGIITIIIWSRAKKIPVTATLDLCSFGVIIGQTIGRWGNFMNREAFGYETDIFCRMGLTQPGQETVYVHPTFLYESVWNLTGFVLLNIWVRKKGRKYDGQVFILYVLWYGIGRALVEGLRTDSLYIGGTDIRVSQLLAALSAAAAAVALIVGAKRKHPEIFVDRVRESASETADTGADEQ